MSKLLKRGAILAAGLGLSVSLAGCTEYHNAQRIGTYTYDGVDYDVYRTEARTLVFETDEGPQAILVPRGAIPTASNVIASCYAPNHAVSRPCAQEFGRVLRARAAPSIPTQVTTTAPTEDDSVMGY